jgi:hypothetical protein
MEEQLTIFEVMRTILLWLNPLVFLEGILLLIGKAGKHIKLEHRLGKEIGGIRKRLIPRIETNIYTFQNWLLKRTYIFGLFFIIYSVMLFIVLRK